MDSASLMKLSSAQSNWRQAVASGTVPEVAWVKGGKAPAGLRLLQDLRRSRHDLPTRLPQRNSAQHTETRSAKRFHSHRIESRTQASGTYIRHFYTAPLVVALPHSDRPRAFSAAGAGPHLLEIAAADRLGARLARQLPAASLVDERTRRFAARTHSVALVWPWERRSRTACAMRSRADPARPGLRIDVERLELTHAGVAVVAHRPARDETDYAAAAVGNPRTAAFVKRRDDVPPIVLAVADF